METNISINANADVMENSSPADDFDTIDCLNAEAWEMVQTKPDVALPLAEKALVLAESAAYNRGIAEAFCSIGWWNYLKCDYPAAHDYSQRALDLGESIADKSVKARALMNLGSVYSGQGNFEKALELDLQALAIKEELGEMRGIASALSNISSEYYHMGNFSIALEYELKALSIRKDIGDRIGSSFSLLNIGNIYQSTAEYEKAREYYLKALSLKEELNDETGATTLLMNLGNLWYYSGNFEKSYEFFNRALDSFTRLGNKNGISMCLNNIASVLFSTEEYDRALEFHRKALLLNEEMENKSNIANSLCNIGEILGLENYLGASTVKSLEYLSKALLLADEIKEKELIYTIHKITAEVYAVAGDAKKTLEHFMKYYETEKEVHNEESSRRIQNLELQNQMAELAKERELERQKSEVTELLLKRVLPVEIADRVKAGEENIADKFPSASVLFADIVGFTPLAARLGADEVLKLLSGIFSHFDKLCKTHGCEKIKTVGDSYMAAAGVPIPDAGHVLKIAKLALAMQEDIKLNLDFKIPELSIRIGIHTGEVIAGVLGTQKLSYDIWGDTVNTAARMESHGEPDMIHCTEEVFKIIKNDFLFKERGETEIKGKGVMKTYFLLKEK